ncbi:aspartate dehydrogenase domain-containing protein [Arenibacter certesii]|uniref:L-aspartate dehydrogenase n=1 Tax=Arenibacter certesii TaxID=228955 RepID=A0A918IQC2_9FLAO|nr:aspartate dehydrogenase domain-containing protein [Arenibacter certesii]GGW26334.1 L-aspartate dehydrogenase [Arenibacter certesii]
MKTKSLAIVGCGKLAHIVVKAINSGLLPHYQLIGAYSRTFEKAEKIAELVSNSQPQELCTAFKTIDELLALKPDYIVEAASPNAFREFAIPALKNGSSIVTLSIGALADTAYYEEVNTAASENNTRVHLVSGAIGGFDVMRTISLMESCTASFDTEKNPNSLKNTPVYEESLQTEKKTVMKGNAKEAIALFPSKVNVAVAASLATVGPDNMEVSITSTPGFVGDRHRIEVKSEQVNALMDIYSKTSQIAGWSVVNTLRNITSPIVF